LFDPNEKSDDMRLADLTGADNILGVPCTNKAIGKLESRQQRGSGCTLKDNHKKEGKTTER
jgi:hypothetical protein